MEDVRRHRTAIARGNLSRPVQLASAWGVITADTSVFDYGCGRGEDIETLNSLGVGASGWDPHFRPDAERVVADVVNLGYVVNVIPTPTERHEVLRAAWDLTRRAMVISARTETELRNLGRAQPHGDGYVTAHGTFQKFYTQAELRSWIDSALETESIALAPGVFVAFKHEEDTNDFLVRARSRRQVAVRVSRSDRIYEGHRELLDELMTFFSERGRLPADDEQRGLTSRLSEAIGSTRKAWKVAASVTPNVDWNAVTSERRLDLLVELALLRLHRRPSFTKLPEQTRHDVRALCGSYRKATEDADSMLFEAGNMERIASKADESLVGKRLPTALYLHTSALHHIPHLLRVYEGCARWLVGEVDGANLIKLATDRPKVSYLEYSTFDREAHPALTRTTFVRLRSLEVDQRDYHDSPNPPILHRKESFLHPDHPHFDKFKRLTDREELAGLYDGDVRSIGNRLAWEERLTGAGWALKGHRLVRRRTTGAAE